MIDKMLPMPVGADNAVISRDLRILVDQAAEAGASANVGVVAGGCDGDLAVGWFLAASPVRPVGVVMIGVFTEGVAEMSSAGDEDAASALAPRTGGPAVADRIRARRPAGVVMIRMPVAVKTASNASVYLASPVSDQELQAFGPLAEVHERVPGLLCRPCGGRVGGDAGQVDAARVVLDDEQHVETAEKDSVDVEEVDRGNGLGLGGQELLPAGGCALRRGVDSGGLEDVPEGRGRDLVPENPLIPRRSAGSPYRVPYHGWAGDRHAARSYSLISPPKTFRRRILAAARSVISAMVMSSQSGGRRFRPRCGRCWL
jgi:hypothetical protein